MVQSSGAVLPISPGGFTMASRLSLCSPPRSRSRSSRSRRVRLTPLPRARPTLRVTCRRSLACLSPLLHEEILSPSRRSPVRPFARRVEGRSSSVLPAGYVQTVDAIEGPGFRPARHEHCQRDRAAPGPLSVPDSRADHWSRCLRYRSCHWVYHHSRPAIRLGTV